MSSHRTLRCHYRIVIKNMSLVWLNSRRSVWPKLQDFAYCTDCRQPLPRSISDYLPHDVKIQILHWAPNVTTLLALVHACPKFLLAFQTAPKVIMTKVTVRQLRENGFDIYHPMLDILHSLNYPDCLVWGQTSPFTSGLKAIHEFVLGRRKC